jgi:dTDP-4-dehydrorhamnose 3,5-epimerase
MIFNKLPLNDAYIIEIDKKGDERGFFARFFCKNEFAEHGLNNDIVQINNSFSAEKGTLRGMHYQLPPNAEVKIVRCIRGKIFDVIIDARKNSSTIGQWFGVELSDDNRKALYVPEGFAHGFLTLEDNVELFYLVTAFYAPEAERGICWDDPFFNIQWPIKPDVISEKDRNHPDFCNEDYLDIG